MMISLNSRGLYVVFRWATGDRPALGFKIKRASAMLLSEREGHARGWRLGPIYLGFYS